MAIIMENNNNISSIEQITEEVCVPLWNRVFFEEFSESFTIAHPVFMADFRYFVEEMPEEIVHVTPGMSNLENPMEAGVCMAIPEYRNAYRMYLSIESTKQFVQFILNLLHREGKKHIPSITELVESVMRHEAWHAKQFCWLYEKGGNEALQRARNYCINTPYTENILEKGAFRYQFKRISQNFETDLRQFLG